MLYGFNLNDRFPNGSNEGQTVEIVYKYCPEYIEWVMKKHDDWYIKDVEKLNLLPEPTPFYTDPEISNFVEKLVKKSPQLNIESIYKYPKVELVLKFIEEYKITPKTYSEQIRVSAKKVESTVNEFNKLLLQLHKLDPINNPKPELIEKSDLSNLKFFFSDEALQENKEKEWLDEQDKKYDAENE